MKIYVDEMPKNCNDCQFLVFVAYHQNGFLHKERYCPLRKDGNCNCSKENCPLQSLAEHDKQIRKEVVQEIREKIEQAKMIYEWKGKEISIEDILDRIEGGEDVNT